MGTSCGVEKEDSVILFADSVTRKKVGGDWQ